MKLGSESFLESLNASLSLSNINKASCFGESYVEIKVRKLQIYLSVEALAEHFRAFKNWESSWWKEM